MKTKYLFAGNLIFFTLFSFAQTTQSSVLIGGDLGLSFSNNKMEIKVEGNGISTEVDNFLIAVNPKLGYFFLNNFAAGVDINYMYQNTYDPDARDDNKSISSKFLGGPFVRYYAPIGSMVSVFGEANTAFGTNALDITTEGSKTTDQTNTLFTWGVGPGITVFPIPNVGIEGIAKYNWFREEEKLFNEDNSQSTENSVTFRVGLIFYL